MPPKRIKKDKTKRGKDCPEEITEEERLEELGIYRDKDK